MIRELSLTVLLVGCCVTEPNLISDKAPHPMTPLRKPEYLETVLDPEFGTKITRITDVTDSGGVIKPLYSTMPAWNADESLLLLWHRGVGHELYEGRSYRFIRVLDIKPRDIEHVAWHATDKDVLFYPTNFKQGAFYRDLIKYYVSTGRKDTLRSFNDLVPRGYGFSFGSDPMWSSWDSKIFGLCDRENKYAFNYNIHTGEVGRILNDTEALAGAPSPNGELFYLNGNVYNFNMDFLRALDLYDPREHATLGMLANGQQIYYTVAFTQGSTSGIGTVVAHDLESGKNAVIVGPATGWPYPPSGTFLSALITKRPGWLIASIVGFKADGQAVLDNEILLVNANTSTVYRVCHHRSKARQGFTGYWGEPHAIPNPNGNRIVFASDWGGKNVDTYIVEF